MPLSLRCFIPRWCHLSQSCWQTRKKKPSLLEVFFDTKTLNEMQQVSALAESEMKWLVVGFMADHGSHDAYEAPRPLGTRKAIAKCVSHPTHLSQCSNGLPYSQTDRVCDHTSPHLTTALHGLLPGKNLLPPWHSLHR